MNCKKCNNRFSVKVFIDGKERNLQSRKYCLDCSPFGEHNTRNLIKGPTLPKICSVCQNPFSIKGTICGSCRVTKWRQEKKKTLVAEHGGKCQICGYDKCIPNMVFHHRDPNEKEFGITGMTISIEKLRAEAEKCILLCCRCHGEVHAGLVSIPEWLKLVVCV